MDRLAGVLLEMQPLDADLDLLAVGHVEQHLALADDRVLVLADLVALRQVRIEVVLAVEDRALVDLRLEPEARPHRLPHAFLVDHRQHAGHRRIDEAHIGVGRRAELGRRAREQLALRGHLRMDLHADDHSPSRPSAPLMKLLGLGVRVSMRGQLGPLRDVVDRPMPRVEPLFQPYAHLRVPAGRAFRLQRQDLVALVLVEIDRPHVVGAAYRAGSRSAPSSSSSDSMRLEQRRADALVLQQRRHEQERDVGAPPRPLAPAHATLVDLGHDDAVEPVAHRLR